jgi:hypothetical protein
MPSSVSILSGFVANGHPIIPNDSCLPSKIFKGKLRLITFRFHNSRLLGPFFLMADYSSFGAETTLKMIHQEGAKRRSFRAEVPQAEACRTTLDCMIKR